MISPYRFIFQLCGEFVHILHILFYVKEIVFICVIYAATVYHQNERDITDFACNKSYFDLDRSMPTRFQVLVQLVIYIFDCLGQVIHLFVLDDHF